MSLTIRRSLMIATVSALAACSADRVAAPVSAPSSRWLAEQHEIGRRMMASNQQYPVVPVYIDGTELKGPTADPGFSTINPDRIATIRLLRDGEAEAATGHPAPNGIIWITTRQPARGH